MSPGSMCKLSQGSANVSNMRGDYYRNPDLRMKGRVGDMRLGGESKMVFPARPANDEYIGAANIGSRRTAQERFVSKI